MSINAGLYLYRSNRVEILSAFYALLIEKHPDPSPFAAIETVVGTPAMGNWLHRQLLQRNGMVANHQFVFPRNMLFQRLGRLVSGDGSVPASSFSQDKLFWAISSHLSALLSTDAFAPVRSHLSGANTGDRSWAQLVLKIATLFDNYLWYRPEWILDWEQGGFAGADFEAHRWQAILWRACAADLQAQFPESSHLPHLLMRAKSANPMTEAPFYVFGLSRFPPSMLTALTHLSKSGEIHLFILNPSDQYWADLRRAFHGKTNLNALSEDQLHRLYAEALLEKEDGHPLLRQWGGQGRTNLFLIERLLDGHQKKDTQYFIGEPGDRSELTALQTLQGDICALRPPPSDPDSRHVISGVDDSIQLHNCHNLTRQLETLKDALYRLFQKDDSLQPKDVLVLSPRFEEVSQLTPAIFGDPLQSLPEGPPAIPYHRIDIPLDVANPVAEALLSLLDLALGRLDHISVLAFLAKPLVRQRFQLSAEHIDQIKTWVGAVNVRWAIDAEDRALNKQPASSAYTWVRGLESMALGIAMQAEDDAPYDRLPLDDVEGADSYVLLRGIEGLRIILETVRQFREPIDISSWLERLSKACDDLFKPELPWQQRTVLSELGEILLNDSESTWTSDAIQCMLAARFKSLKSERAPLKNAITFGSLHPERNIPYRVIALVGMDDGAFPGSRSAEGMDLMNRSPLPGDPHAAHENRYLLLEELLCARERLLIFYTGRDERSNKDLPAAPPIQELKEILVESFVDESGADVMKSLERKHPLHPFDIKGFQPGFQPELASFQAAMCPTPLAPRKGTSQSFVYTPPQRLSLRELLSFLRHPIRYQQQRNHNLHLSTWVDAIEEREPFVDTKNLSYQMAIKMVQGFSCLADRAEIKRRVQVSLPLPLGAQGEAIFDERYGHMLASWQRRIKKWPIPQLPQDSERHEVELPSGLTLSFDCPPVSSHMVFFHCDRSSAVAQRAAFLQYCCALAAGLIESEQAIGLLLYVGSDKPILSELKFKLPVENRRELARRHLSHAIAIYHRGMRGELCAMPKAGAALLDACVRKPFWSREELLDPAPESLPAYRKMALKVVSAWESGKGEKFASFGDVDCPHIQLQYPDNPPLLNPETRLFRPEFIHDSLDTWGGPLGIPVLGES